MPSDFAVDVVSLQAFVEQLLRGLRLTLNMDGVGLDVHAKLDQKCTCLELTFSNVLKRISLKSIRSVLPAVSTDAVRSLEDLERPPCGKAAWATKIQLEDDRVCEFIFDVQREAEYFGCSLKAMCQDARLQTARPFDDADLAAGLPTTRARGAGSCHIRISASISATGSFWAGKSCSAVLRCLGVASESILRMTLLVDLSNTL